MQKCQGMSTGMGIAHQHACKQKAFVYEEEAFGLSYVIDLLG